MNVADCVLSSPCLVGGNPWMQMLTRCTWLDSTARPPPNMSSLDRDHSHRTPWLTTRMDGHHHHQRTLIRRTINNVTITQTSHSTATDACFPWCKQTQGSLWMDTKTRNRFSTNSSDKDVWSVGNREGPIHPSALPILSHSYKFSGIPLLGALDGSAGPGTTTPPPDSIHPTTMMTVMILNRTLNLAKQD